MNNKMINQKRRDFLEFVSKTGIASRAIKGSSLLAGLMANRHAHAQNEIKRVVFVYTPLGAPSGRWLPKQNSLNEATQAYEGLQSLCHFHETFITNAGFGLIHKSLSELRWTNDWTSDTIDHQIAKVLGTTTPFPTLHFGVQTNPIGTNESISRKNGTSIPAMDNPSQAYNTLFGSPNSTPPSHFTANITRSNILDAHLESLNCSRTKLSSEEQTAIEQYETALSSLQNKLINKEINTEMCHRPNWNAAELSTLGPTPEVRGPFAEQAKLQAEIIGHSLACGLTNVATLQLGDDNASLYGHDTIFKGDLHGASCAAGIEAYTEMVNYLSRCIAYLIEELANKDDPAAPGTKLLDNTVIVQVGNIGDGPTHSGTDAPSLIATRMPEFKTGLATACRADNDTNLRVLQTIAAGLGLEQYIGQESHHCIWPCGDPWGGIDTSLLS